MPELDLSQFDGHTPGNWQIKQEPEGLFIAFFEPGDTCPSPWYVAEVVPNCGPGLMDKSEANARLIAAAPTLLAELREARARIAVLEADKGELAEGLNTLVSYVDIPCGGCGDFPVPVVTMAVTKALLAKHRGEK